MKNHWIIPRNKRTLTPVVEILSAFHISALGQQWSGHVSRQIEFEDALEYAGIKRVGTRRDQGGSGARTYEAWLSCLGLIFIEEKTGFQRLTVAGEALLAGEPPVRIITDQLIKLQYPSSYSKRTNVDISSRFEVHPFRFILSLLHNTNLEYLTQIELALFVLTEGENDTESCIQHVAKRISEFRKVGLSILPVDFPKKYPSRNGIQDLSKTIGRLNDNANTFVNYLEYTQLAARDTEKKLRIINSEKVSQLLSEEAIFFPRPGEQEYFQRKYGLIRGKTKDTRSFGAGAVTEREIQKQFINRELLIEASHKLISATDSSFIRYIAEKTGCPINLVAESAAQYQGRETRIFEAEYYRMAIDGREQAKEFEFATAEIFGEKGFGFKATHIGNMALHPDIHVESPIGYTGIIDNKAYSSYSITNDHYNRMVHNYIQQYKTKNGEKLKFFLYVAGGFKSTFGMQLNEIAKTTGISGAGISAENLILLLDKHKNKRISHNKLLKLFTCNKEITLTDINENYN